jgi:hypothetical protein
MRRRSRFSLALVGLLAGACQGKADAQATASDRGEARPSEPSPESPGAVAEEPEVQEAQPEAQETADPDPLGQRFMDPPWYRTSLLEGAEVVTSSRSEADEDGFFSSHILFALPEGTSREACADQVSAGVEPHVPGLERTIEGDRIKITGSTDRYRVILICGETKGVMRAYVSMEWFA